MVMQWHCKSNFNQKSPRGWTSVEFSSRVKIFAGFFTYQKQMNSEVVNHRVSIWLGGSSLEWSQAGWKWTTPTSLFQTQTWKILTEKGKAAKPGEDEAEGLGKEVPPHCCEIPEPVTCWKSTARSRVCGTWIMFWNHKQLHWAFHRVYIYFLVCF